MGDFPENLQIKREISPPSTPEDKSPHNIKAKLNLHVKRRLQDFNPTGEESSAVLNTTKVDVKPEGQKKETTRQKRPYHKRTDRNKSSIQSLHNPLTASTESDTIITPQRKYKHKIKQVVPGDGHDLLTSNYNEENASSINNTTITSGAVSAGDEDENELKSGREKEKCPDVLAMVLSLKKRTLLQDPEVANFLEEIMKVIKS